MQEIIARLNAINHELTGTFCAGNREIDTLIRNRRKSERDGIVFALRSLGICVENHLNDGWVVVY